MEKMDKTSRLYALHTEVMQALEGVKPNFDVKGAFDFVVSLPRFFKKNPVYLETRIAVSVMRRIRPTQTKKCVESLQNLRAAAGESAQFDAFWHKIEKNLGTLNLTWHGYTEKTFATSDFEAVKKDLSDLFDNLATVGVTAFLNSGTLLGLVRDGRFIDHDDDIDIGIVLNAANVEEVGQAWLEFQTAMLEMGLLVPRKPNQDCRTVNLKSCAGFSVDAFPCWIENDQVYVYPHTFGEIGRDRLLPFGECKITGLPIPRDPAAMLAVNYGSGWMRKDPHFVFPHKKMSVVFSDLKHSILTSQSLAA